jgi:hypothetical protein
VITTNNDSKLRTFELIDEEGYIKRHELNKSILKDVGSKFFIGNVSEGGVLYNWSVSNRDLITPSEFKFFKEITEKVTIDKPQPPYQGIIDDCKAVDGSLCIYKEGVVFLWEDSEYVINSTQDYADLISSIKVLQRLQKVCTIESLTNEGGEN